MEKHWAQKKIHKHTTNLFEFAFKCFIVLPPPPPPNPVPLSSPAMSLFLLLLVKFHRIFT
jgi:hypothetical protein